jgi:hypothetical protein
MPLIWMSGRARRRWTPGWWSVGSVRSGWCWRCGGRTCIRRSACRRWLVAGGWWPVVDLGRRVRGVRAGDVVADHDALGGGVLRDGSELRHRLWLAALGTTPLDRLRSRTALYLHPAEKALTGRPGTQVVRAGGSGGSGGLGPVGSSSRGSRWGRHRGREAGDRPGRADPGRRLRTAYAVGRGDRAAGAVRGLPLRHPALRGCGQGPHPALPAPGRGGRRARPGSRTSARWAGPTTGPRPTAGSPVSSPFWGSPCGGHRPGTGTKSTKPAPSASDEEHRSRSTSPRPALPRRRPGHR